MKKQRHGPKFEAVDREPVFDPVRAWNGALLRRMGATQDRLRWLVEDFARRREYRDARTGSPLADSATPGQVARELTMFLLYQNGVGTLPLGPLPMPAKQLRALASEVCHGVNCMLDGKDWAVKVPARMTRSVRSEKILLGPGKGKPKIVTSWSDPSVPRAQAFGLIFLLCAQDLVATELESLRKCPGCETVFVRDDKRQTYCRPACAGTARMRKLRSKKRKRRGAP